MKAAVTAGGRQRLPPKNWRTAGCQDACNRLEMGDRIREFSDAVRRATREQREGEAHLNTRLGVDRPRHAVPNRPDAKETGGTEHPVTPPGRDENDVYETKGYYGTGKVDVCPPQTWELYKDTRYVQAA